MTTQGHQRQTTGEMASQEQWQEHGTGAMLPEHRRNLSRTTNVPCLGAPFTLDNRVYFGYIVKSLDDTFQGDKPHDHCSCTAVPWNVDPHAVPALG